MQITPQYNSFNKINSLKANNNLNPQSYDVSNSPEASNSSGMCAAELLGKSMVNFCGKSNSDKPLNKADSNFADVLGKIYRLDDKQIKNVKTIISDFLKENNFNSISDMKSDDIFEFANEEAVLAEQLSKKLDLTEYEELSLTMLLTSQVDMGDISKFRNRKGESFYETNKYVRDFTPLENIINNHGIDDYETVTKVFNHLTNAASDFGCDSIYEMFLPENCKFTAGILNDLSKPEYGKFNKEQITDILIDLVNLSGKTTEERLDGINRNGGQDEIDEGIQSIALAGKISKKFNIEISEKLLELIDSRNAKRNQKSRSEAEIAFMISEEFNLPRNSFKQILEIFETQKNQTNKEVFHEFAEILRKESQTKK